MTATPFVEPWRARAGLPIIKGLVVDRGALDRIIRPEAIFSGPPAGAGRQHDPDTEGAVDSAMDAAGLHRLRRRCVAACPNGRASLFTTSRLSHLGPPAPGATERYRRLRMVARMDIEHFRGCTL
jgi:succinate dehydrogenase / fumarate reductase iron-sulfur subunit